MTGKPQHEPPDFGDTLARHDVRLTGVETSVGRLTSALESTQSVLLAKIESSFSTLSAKIDQHKADSRPNVIGWIGAAGVAVTISLSIGATIGGTVTALQSARAN